MDSDPEIAPPAEDSGLLSYDDTVPYEEQAGPSLADRIGNTKVYLLADSIPSKLGKRYGKRKHEDVEDEGLGDDVDMDDDPSLRHNAILLYGSPISNLPTSNIFAYSTHFDALPIGLEWIDDTTCILVFESRVLAVAAYRRLQKSVEDELDVDGFVTAKQIPVAIWPPEMRINESLGKGEGLRGAIRMRWARKDDVKEKGARNKSQFYKKHGGFDDSVPKRRRKDEESDAVVRARLDDDLDSFIAGDDVGPASPPSRMRSANMDANGNSLVERTSVRVRPPRNSRPPRRGRGSEGGARRGRGGSRPEPRVSKSQQELDDELDAFLNERD